MVKSAVVNWRKHENLRPTSYSFGINYFEKLDDTSTLNCFLLFSNAISGLADGVQYYAGSLIHDYGVYSATRWSREILVASSIFQIIKYAVTFTVSENCIAFLIIAYKLFFTIAFVF